MQPLMVIPEHQITQHPITVEALFRQVSERLQLSWIAGQAGGGKLLTSDTVQKPTLALFGHTNFVHPNRLQVLGCAEMDYLRNLSPENLKAAVENLFCNEIAAVIIANGEIVPSIMIDRAEHNATPLLTSPEPGPQLMRVLSHMMTLALAPSTILHGVFLEVSGLGVLITGEPSAGKSELALELITRGHRLIADDALEVFAVSPDTLEGRCPNLLLDFMEVRGLGVLNVRRLFGDAAVKQKKNLKLIVHLAPVHEFADKWQEVDRLNMLASNSNILGVDIPEVRIPVAVGRNLAVLVEVAVRNHILRLRGFNSAQEFAERHRAAIQAGDE